MPNPWDVTHQTTLPPGTPTEGLPWWMQHRVWQEVTTPTPYHCDRCQRDDLKGPRFIATAMGNGYQAVSVVCPECRWKPELPVPKKRKPKRAALPD